MSDNHHKLIILGSGPAGLTAAIYAGRANLNPVLIHGEQPGGQLTITTEVENFPGFAEGIQGPDLMDRMTQQAERFGTKTLRDTVNRVDLDQHPLVIETEAHGVLTTDSLIIATGASAKLIGLPEEKTLMGHGVSACATCDGFFFRDKAVVVVGGGDTAMEEAVFLTRFCKRVTVIHRRDTLRATQVMQQRAKTNPKIDFIWDSVVERIQGSVEEGVKAVLLKNLKTGETSTFEAQGVFVAIGHQPNTSLFKEQLTLNEVGYILVDPGTVQTNREGVFACGDVQDARYRQAITAAGSGCMAAMDAEKYLADHNEVERPSGPRQTQAPQPA